MNITFEKLPLPVPKILLTPSQALRRVLSKDGLGVYASDDTLFKGAVFGRDSLEVAEDLMTVQPKLVRSILLTLASLQGEANNKTNEEEPGEIIHEYRRRVVDHKKIDANQLRIFEDLSARWGGSADELAYFGSIDATPHFIKVLAKYTKIHDSEFLLKDVILRSGRRASLLEVVDLALDWLLLHLNQSKSGLLEFQRVNPEGIANQVWKDSRDFYVHTNGQLANHNLPIASIEVQGLAYDALVMAAELLPSRRDQLLSRAEQLQNRTIELLWQGRKKYFYLGLDYDDSGRVRFIKTLTANPAVLLDSRFFEELPEDKQQYFVSEISREILGTEFLTDVGIRSRALTEAHLIKHWDYHGSFTSWPKETYDIAKGLRRWGLPKLAIELENRLLNATRSVGLFPEFYFVDARGRILGIPTDSRTHGTLIFIDSHHAPERIQAWTVSAVIAINHSRRFWRRRKSNPQQLWQHELEEEVLMAIPHMPELKSTKELAARYPAYSYRLRRTDK